MDRYIEVEVAAKFEGWTQKFRSLRIAGRCAAAVVICALLTPIVVVAKGDQLSSTDGVPANFTLPEGLSPADWQQIQTQIDRYRQEQRYQIQAVDEGFTASNLTHSFDVRFEADGSTQLILAGTDNRRSHQITLKPLALGYGFDADQSRQSLIRPSERTADGAVVSTAWNDSLKEWWVNSPAGLEQWLELATPPVGRSSSDEPLIVTMALDTTLEASVQGHGEDQYLQLQDDAASVRFEKLRVFDAEGRAVPASMQLTGQMLAYVIDDRQARYPLTIDPAFVQQAYLKASSNQVGASFGWSVATSGDTVVVGAYREASQSGAAYVFVRSGGTWEQQAFLKASNADNGDQFGHSVAVSDDTIVVGAHFEESNATGVNGDENDDSASFSGAAYVFVRSAGTWSQQAYLKASNTGSGDRFGRSVSVSGNTVVVGAQLEDSNAIGVDGDGTNNSASNSGAAYVFMRSGNTWAQQAYLKASNTDSHDEFGFSVAVSGDTVVVGALWEDSNATGVDGDGSDNSATSSGAAYVFVHSDNTWSQQAYLKAHNAGSGDVFGISVAISGDTVVAGAAYEASSATGVDGDGSDNSANFAGAAYVFVCSGGTWSQQAYLKASNTESFDRFGWSVTVSGGTVVVGANLEDSNATGVDGNGGDNSASDSGAAYVFVRSDSNWSQQTYLKASNTGSDDQFGQSVAVSGDTVVVGAFAEASNATGVDGDGSDNSALNSGAAYVFGVPAFTVGGEVVGLFGSGLVLRNNDADDLPISSNGSFEFDTALLDGTGYEVTVAVQPTNPSQTCIVSNGAGNLAGADVTDVDVTCTTDSYTVTTLAINGSITSTVDPVVEWGQTTTVIGQADANHYFVSVDGCNGTQQSNSDQSITDFSYETGEIEADCTVSAEFLIRTYSMASTVSSGQGNIDVLTPVVEHGNNADFEVTPDSGWSLQSFTGDTCTPFDNGDGTWTATTITSDCEVTAVFIEDTSTALVTGMSPAIVGIPVTYTISVTGTTSAPADGQVELISDLDGVICNLTSADTIDGQTAVFSCQHSWNVAGEHLMTAIFSDSTSHKDSDDQIQQTIVSNETVFNDRFESNRNLD